VEENMSNGSKMTFTAVHNGDSHETTGVLLSVEHGNELWKSRIMGPAEFAELMLASHVFPPTKADGLFRRIQAQGQVIEKNVSLTEKNMQFLGLSRAN
jgi:hypothetical protein